MAAWPRANKVSRWHTLHILPWAEGNAALFPQVSSWEDASCLSCTLAALHKRCPKCLSLWCRCFNWISFKVQMNLERGLGRGRRGALCQRLWTPLQGWLNRSVCSLSCSSSCLDLLLIDSRFVNRKCSRVTRETSPDVRAFISSHTYAHNFREGSEFIIYKDCCLAEVNTNEA